MENYFINYENIDFKEFIDFIDEHEFKGFDAIKYASIIKNDPPKDSIKIGILGAIQGGNWEKYKPLDQQMLIDHGYIRNISKNKASGKSVLRTTSVLAPEVVVSLYYRPERLQIKYDVNLLPIYLQFPGAASIQMNERIRKAHKDFCKEFSLQLPNGKFNENIYENMANNARPLPKGSPKGLVDILM